MITNEKAQKIAAAAREWLSDSEGVRWSESERMLALAVMNAFPEDRQTKETCTCGEQATCEDCPTDTEFHTSLESFRQHIAREAH